MAKRRRGGQTTARLPGIELPSLTNEIINELVCMLDQGQFLEVILIIEQYREEHPREPVLYKLLGTAYAEVGELQSAAERWEEAQRLDPGDPSTWRLLTGVYQLQGRLIHALRALRRYMSEESDDPDRAVLEQLREALEASLRALATQNDVPVAEAERAGLLLERGLRLMEEGDYLGANRHFRDASRALPRWTAPRNNLALCQFQLGNLDAAIRLTEEVLAQQADDVAALANLTRFYHVTGRADEAAQLADRLWALVQPALDQERQEAGSSGFEFERAANAFSSLDQDERVIGTLERRPQESLSENGSLLLGAALANANRKSAAQPLFDAAIAHPLAQLMGAALRLNEQPPGGRFQPHGTDDLLPDKLAKQILEELNGVLTDDAAERAAREARLREIFARAPTFLPAYYAALWMADELTAVNAVALLLTIDLPETVEAVRTFAFGRLGPDDTRLFAALALREANKVNTSRPLLLWQDGRYQEMLPPRYTITTDEAAAPYPPAIARALEKALERRGKNDLTGAERLYRQVLEQDPTNAEAAQALGLTLLSRDDTAGAEEQFRVALEQAPDSVLARTLLASLRIGQKRLSEARDLLVPLTDRANFTANDLASFLFTTAELAEADGDNARARQQLRLLLAYVPGHSIARLRLRELEAAEKERRQGEERDGQRPSGLVSSRGTIPILGPRQ